MLIKRLLLASPLILVARDLYFLLDITASSLPLSVDKNPLEEALVSNGTSIAVDVALA